jgi:hypothetical protein
MSANRAERQARLFQLARVMEIDPTGQNPLARMLAELLGEDMGGVAGDATAAVDPYSTEYIQRARLDPGMTRQQALRAQSERRPGMFTDKGFRIS